MLFLVVDDDTLSRELLTLLLEAEGYEVEAAASGEAAVERIAACMLSDAKGGAQLPDVILADVQMPGLAGDVLAAALRVELDNVVRDNAAARLVDKAVLLAMSGSQPAKSKLTGFDGFLLKPFSVSELRVLVQRSKEETGTGYDDTAGETASSEEAILGAAPYDSLQDALDEEIYAKMCDLMPVEQLGQMYGLCVEDARKRITRMETLAAEGDDAEYRKEAHAVKGGSGMIGASELYQLAAAAEQDGLLSPDRSSGTSGVTATLTRLSVACDRLERILQERTQRQEQT